MRRDFDPAGGTEVLCCSHGDRVAVRISDGEREHDASPCGDGEVQLRSHDPGCVIGLRELGRHAPPKSCREVPLIRAEPLADVARIHDGGARLPTGPARRCSTGADLSRLVLVGRPIRRTSGARRCAVRCRCASRSWMCRLRRSTNRRDEGEPTASIPVTRRFRRWHQGHRSSPRCRSPLPSACRRPIPGTLARSGPPSRRFRASTPR